MKIIGITGRTGAGKSTVAKYLVDKYGYIPLSVREAIQKEVVKKLGRENKDRDELIEVANEIRKERGAEYFVIQLYKKAIQDGKDCIIESIRTVGEVEALREQENFVLLAIDAPFETRFERIQNLRKEKEDKVTLDEFLRQELKENTSELKTEQNISKCILLSDAIINNDWINDTESLHNEIETVMNHLNGKQEGKIVGEKEIN